MKLAVPVRRIEIRYLSALGMVFDFSGRRPGRELYQPLWLWLAPDWRREE